MTASLRAGPSFVTAVGAKYEIGFLCMTIQNYFYVYCNIFWIPVSIIYEYYQFFIFSRTSDVLFTEFFFASICN